jgi:TetR/AcrR family tetracycline transcriptional repressor
MTSRTRDRHLTRDEILDAALRIVDAEGLEALTMRRLADALGVEAMSLYYHVPNKDTLLDWTVERMRAEMRLPETAPDDWADALEAIFAEYRRVLVAHPNMLPLAARRTEHAGMSGLQYLVDQGVPFDDAVELYQSLVAFTIGFSVLGSSTIEPGWTGLPRELADRLRDWREPTFRRTLRIVMAGCSERQETRRKR